LFVRRLIRNGLVGTLAAASVLGACSRRRHDRIQAGRSRIRQLAEVASPLDTGLSSNSKQRFINLMRYRLNLSLPAGEGRKWDLWAEGSSPFPLPGGKGAFLLSFRRVLNRDHQEGLLIIGRLEGQMPVVVAQWKRHASIDDMHAVDMGAGLGVLLHTVAMGPVGAEYRELYNDLLRLDGHHLVSTWSVRGGYSRDAPAAYRPPVIRFTDVNKDGRREVLVRVPGKNAPRRKGRRWAVFAWTAYQMKFVPRRGLAWSGVARQRPVWSATGFFEALKHKDRSAAERFVSYPRRGCQPLDDIVYMLAAGKWGVAGDARLLRSKDNQAVVRVPLKSQLQQAHYEAELDLRQERTPLPSWTICRVKILKW